MAPRLSPDVSNGTKKVYVKKVRRGVGNCPRDTSRTEATKRGRSVFRESAPPHCPHVHIVHTQRAEAVSRAFSTRRG